MSGGSSETELKELIVTPTDDTSYVGVVTTQTPVGNCPRACRNSFGSKVISLFNAAFSNCIQNALLHVGIMNTVPSIQTEGGGYS